MASLPIAVLILSAAVAGLTQIVKYLTEKGGAAWTAEAAQIAAAVVSSLLALAGSLHLPFGVGAILVQVINQLGAPLTGILVSAGSYILHDLAAIAQNLLVFLQSKMPTARK